MINPSDLRYFCYHLIRKYGSPDNASEEQKADEFRHYYLRDLPPTLKALRTVAVCCGLRVCSSDELPRNVRGYNHVLDGTDNIVTRDGDTVSGTQNTILHEIREIMERTFPTVSRNYRPLRTNARHYAANRFAAAVLLPRVSFRDRVYDAGLDVIELANRYLKSCSQVLLRIGEVLQGKLFFYAGMYEPGQDGDWRVSYWTGSGNHHDPDANIYGLNGFFPRKGRGVLPDSLVDMAIRTGRPHIAERITLTDDGDDEGLVAIANPQMIQGIPAKVILTVLMARNSSLLAPKIERIHPVMVDGFHRHL